MVAMDAGFLGLLLHPNAKPPNDPATKKPLLSAPERIEKLVEELHGLHERVILPTPALCEFLVLAGKDAQQYLYELSIQPGFYIRPFDQMAAIELAAMESLARGKGSKRSPAGAAIPWQKVKFDRQIVAIAKVHQAHTLYSDDGDVKAIAEDAGIKVIPCWELPLPPSTTPLFDGVPDPPEELPVTPVEAKLAIAVQPTGRKIRFD
jgi:hypothetical protein